MKQNLKDIIIQSVATMPSKISLGDISKLDDAGQFQYLIGDHVLNDVIHAFPKIAADEDYEIYKYEFYDLVGEDAEDAWYNACKGSETIAADEKPADFAVQIAGSFDIAFSEILEEQELN